MKSTQQALLNGMLLVIWNPLLENKHRVKERGNIDVLKHWTDWHLATIFHTVH